jgi:dienelactone hydrolase
MPDLFRGKPFPPTRTATRRSWASSSPERECGGLNDIVDDHSANLERLPEVIKFAEYLKKERGFHSVSLLGYCWGEW